MARNEIAVKKDVPTGMKPIIAGRLRGDLPHVGPPVSASIDAYASTSESLAARRCAATCLVRDTKTYASALEIGGAINVSRADCSRIA